MNDLQKRVKAMVDDIDAAGEVPMLRERLQNLIKSLDRICSACLASTSAETHELLHRGKTCPNVRNQEHPRSACCVLCDKDPEDCECP